MHRILFVTAVAALLVSACAPAIPTVDPASVQASAVAAASTMIAQTVAAVPTSTPVPPTPLPTDTPQPVPTLPVLPTVANPTATTASAGSSNCNHLMDVGASGPTAPLQIQNNTKGQISGSVWINTKNTFGQCGWIGYGPIAKGNTGTIQVPLVHTNLGDTCYWAAAYAVSGQPHGGPFCIDNQLKWVMKVGPDAITIAPP
jgi:hypothetical protein